MTKKQDQPEVQLASDLAKMQEMFAVLEESARGMRQRLEREGWSPTVAEQVAAHWLISTLTGASS
ncbi:hypothetical protein JL108_14430 [Aeromicrobium sp. YIM 150415]|uniref:hypothetical protein n=1 Tax=Aeromicrobium sp. YIM 150415 TaxID=2803912 RepID=UPI001964B1AE|nr:hypothetical protein [Aeromicrobium sp. YIM 150415]MBM9464650.1 hypothetical protein [Aeromicrobium sp. YIM 150415]